MIPSNFKESNRILKKPNALTDNECGDLNVYTNGRECISLWKPSLRERISILIHGNVWLSIHTGQSQPPVWLDGSKTIFIKPKKLPFRDRLELFLTGIANKIQKAHE